MKSGLKLAKIAQTLLDILRKVCCKSTILLFQICSISKLILSILPFLSMQLTYVISPKGLIISKSYSNPMKKYVVES